MLWGGLPSDSTSAESHVAHDWSTRQGYARPSAARIELTPLLLDMTPLWCHYGAMELAPYVADLQRQLVDAADNGTAETRAVAERLAAGLDAATRLVLLDALSAAVGEITRDLAPG